MKLKAKKIKRNGGAAMLISVIFFLFITLAIIFGLVSPTVREFRNSSVNLQSKNAYFLAESGEEDAVYRIKNNLAISSSETITLNSSSATTTITNIVGGGKQVVSLGDVNSLQRKITVVLKTGDGAVFKYGTQAGQGGFVFQNNSHISGSIYSNGDVVGSNGAYITGDAFAAGNTGSISNMCIGGTVQSGNCTGTTVGSAHAHTVTNTNATGNIYCQTGSGNNKTCDTSQADPITQALPIQDASITQWETDATNGGVTNGNVTISSPTTIGPRKIVGNLIVNSTLTIANTIYVTGNVTIGINATVKLDPSFGTTSGMIISDGYIIINNGVAFQDSGTAGSYILLLSNSTCDASILTSPCNGNNAISVSNNSNISIVNAQKGTVYFSNNASVKESVGNTISLKNNVGISYGTGLINVGFTSGPSGSWFINSWGESQ
ncbi:MAG: hypothetical protein KGL67_00235 [Patescibacteria group bacterium]|nr:hypothetical protein [Patescibacteria group bacterium]